jgi:DNA-binding response OmpR family regulator
MTKPFFIDELIERIKQLLSTNWSMKERMLNA